MARKTSPAQDAKADEKPKLTAIRDAYTKTQVVQALAEQTGLQRKQVQAVFAALAELIHRHLKKRGAGEFTLAGIAKFKVATRAATKARKGRNPFTQEEITIPAKPARRVVRIRPNRSIHEMAES